MSVKGLYYFENSMYRKKLFSPLKKSGFVPEKYSELFVAGIPYEANIYELTEYFEQIGNLFQVKLMTKPGGELNRGYGFVTFLNHSLAVKALKQLASVPFKGRLLSMKISMDNCRIFVSGIPQTKSKDEIWQTLISTYKIQNIVNVFTYRDYQNARFHRGFAFLEFRTHEEAAYFRAKYWDKLVLFGKKCLVDTALPVVEMSEEDMDRMEIKIIFVRNLDVTMTFDQFSSIVYRLMSKEFIEKIYKFKNYAYIHLDTREHAERLMQKLKDYYANTVVEVTYAKPPNKYTERNYREKALTERLSSLSTPRIRTDSRAVSTQSSEASSLSPQYPSSSSSTLNAFDSDVCPRPIHGTTSGYWNQSDPVVSAMPSLSQTWIPWTSPLFYQGNQCNHPDEPVSAIDFEAMVTKLVHE